VTAPARDSLSDSAKVVRAVSVIGDKQVEVVVPREPRVTSRSRSRRRSRAVVSRGFGPGRPPNRRLGRFGGVGDCPGLGLPSKDVNWLGRHADHLFDEADLARVAGLPKSEIRAAAGDVVLRWPRTPLDRLEGLSEDDVDGLREASVESVQEL
jgi:hypothetical protein